MVHSLMNMREGIARCQRSGIAVLATGLLMLAGCASTGGEAGQNSGAASADARPTQPVAQAATTVAPRPATASAARPSAAGPEEVAPSTRTVTVQGESSTASTVVVAKPVEPAGPDSLWTRIRDGFGMPELDTPLVADKERFYLQQPDYLQRMFARGERYLYYIVSEVEKRGMPTELALLPFVESAMNPVALSSAQAAGLWQFVPATGRQYNLSQNWWVDNRRDVVRSTQAALDYLQTIYTMHGNDWFLALASYNWGENAVARAVSRNRAKGRGTDYLSLPMPNETRHYVPKLIALKHIIQRADELGVQLPKLANKPYFVTIEKTGPIDLKLAAQFAGMSVDEFVALNPAHNRPVIAATRNNEIKLPADRLDGFMDAVERHGASNKPFASWQPHTLASGETLETVAQRGGITVAELRRANGLSNQTRPLAGTRIIAPRRVVEDETRVERFEGPRVYEQVHRPAAYHVVGRNETLASVARRYGVPPARLSAWNGLSGGVARRGTRLMVRPASSQTLLTDERGGRQIVATAVEEPAQPIRVSTPVETPTASTAAPVTPAAPAARAPVKAARPAARAPQARQAASAGRPANARAPAPRPTASRAAPAKPAASAAKPARPAAHTPKRQTRT